MMLRASSLRNAHVAKPVALKDKISAPDHMSHQPVDGNLQLQLQRHHRAIDHAVPLRVFFAVVIVPAPPFVAGRFRIVLR
jgi:hypothetical protein